MTATLTAAPLSLLDFKKGMRVTYTGAKLHHDGRPYAGMAATVVRPVKSRQVVTIRWDDESEPGWFDAYPSRLAPLG